MADIIWPSSLPPLRGLSTVGGANELHPETKDTQFDDGPDMSRRRSLYVQTPLNMQIPMTPAQFAVFKAFHLNDLNTGTKWFKAPVLLPGMSVGQRTCRIKGKVGVSAPNTVKWLVSFTLLVQDW